jgi:hypothetical protein
MNLRDLGPPTKNLGWRQEIGKAAGESSQEGQEGPISGG